MRMRLSEFYTKEKFYYKIDGVRISRDLIKTKNGELYVDEDRNLYYKENSSSPTLLHTDVGEWIYFNDNKIVCESYHFDDSFDTNYICVVDIHGNIQASGAITQFGFVYSKDNHIIKEDSNQNETVIIELNSSEIPVMYYDESFSISFYYPHSNFIYSKLYDYNGNYLKKETETTFLKMFLRDLIYAFTNCPIEPNGLIEQQKSALSQLDKIRFGTSKITYEIIDRIISVLEEGQILNKNAARGYQIIKKLFISYDIKDNLVKPLLNIMVVNQSGEFTRRTTKWISLINAKRIESIARKSKGDFKNIVYDIEQLWENMRVISSKNTGEL